MDLCLEALTAADIEAPQLAAVAARNGLRSITVLTSPIGGGRHDLVGDTPTRRETRQRCHELGVEVLAVDGLGVSAFATDAQIDALERAVESAAWLGAKQVNAITFTSPEEREAIGQAELERRLLDRFHRFCDIADRYPVKVMTELSVRMALQSVPMGAQFVERLGRGVRLVVDALHFHRNYGVPSQLIDAAPWIGHCQLCDGPASMPPERQREEALSYRLNPGEGALPLLDFVRALPGETTFGIEVPRQDLIDAGVSADERCRRAIEATRALLAESGRM